MASSQKVDDCLICLEPLKTPIRLSCNHSFCAGCIQGWRSKYDALSDRTCPKCRAALPPTKEMKSQLVMEREVCSMVSAVLQKEGPLPMPKLTTDPGYRNQSNKALYIPLFDDEHVQILRELPEDDQQIAIRAALQSLLEIHADRIKTMEQNISASDETLDDEEEETCEELPLELSNAVRRNNVKTILDWLGPNPSPERINAKCEEKMRRTLLHEAEFENNVNLMRILLQLGAHVDPRSSYGSTPLSQACVEKRLDKAARLLLEWGAEVGINADGDNFHNVARDSGNVKLARLLETPLGGRRCEIVGLQRRNDLNGKAGVAERYLSKQDVYIFTLEDTASEKQQQQIKVRPSNLKRRDKTPRDCGSIVRFTGVGPGGQNMFEEGPCIQSEEKAEDDKGLLEQDRSSIKSNEK